MRKLFSILIVITVIAGFASAYERDTDTTIPQQPEAAGDTGEGELVDLKSDVVYPVKINEDSTVYCLVGNFAAHHNGAVIVCDSAVRYSDKRIECFGNVLINKNETYIYGDRAEYNGEINEAQVYSKLVKVVDGDATLYTYKFKFDTKLNIGEFDDGGVVTNKDNMLESDRGYYYADTHEVICVDNVEMANEQYEMDGDSVIYNIETDRAQFFSNTDIWNDKGEYLYADRGSYEKDSDKYVITENGYILTENQELWSDSLDYYRERGYALLKSNIQIDDQEHKTLAFGNWGEYWKEPGDAFLSKDPAIVNYDLEQGDSLFMRADSIFLYSRSTQRDKEEAARAALIASMAANDSTAMAETARNDSLPAKGKRQQSEGQQGKAGGNRLPSLNNPIGTGPLGANGSEVAGPADSLPAGETATPEDMPVGADSLATESGIVDSLDGGAVDTLPVLSKKEQRAKLREEARKRREEIKKEEARIRKIKLDSIADVRQAKKTALLDKMAAREQARADKRRARMLARLARKGIKVKPDTVMLALADSIMTAEGLFYDSVANHRLDSILFATLDSLGEETLADTAVIDTQYRLILGYRNVRIYRSDFQSACDSMSSSTLDSVIRLYIEPVLWHEENQVTSTSMDIYTKNQQLDHAEFIDNPMMVSKIDTLHYNQVAGKTMISYFRNNEIYRDDVNGNAQTIYYMQEDGSPEVQGLMYIESADMTFYIEEKQITGITYRGSPNYIIYPMDKIPETQPLFLQGFTWQDERRPFQRDVFDRTIRPSLREAKTALPRPTFPISEKMERYKREIIDRNEWYDRNDVLTQEVIEWLESETNWKEETEKGKRQREERMNR